MRKILIIAFQQFKLLALHWSFLFALLTPLLLVVFSGVYAALLGWSTSLERTGDSPPAPNVVVVNPEPFAQTVGLVDHSGLLTDIPPDFTPEQLTRYPDEASARAAAEAGLIAGYYLIPADYVERGLVTYHSPGPVQFPATDEAIKTLLLLSLTQADGDAIGRRLAEPVAFDSVTLTFAGTPPPGTPDPILLTDLAIVGGLSLFIQFTIGNACNLFLSQMARERQGRVLESVLGSVSARQLLAGKYLGLTAVGLLETAAWAAWVRLFGATGEALGGPAIIEQINAVGGAPATLSPPASLSQPEVFTTFDPILHTSGGLFLLCGLILVSGYLAYMAMAAAFGAITQDTRQASRVNTLLALIVQSPIVIILFVLADRDGPLAVFFSLLPLTSPMVMTTRILLSPVPLWQVGLSAALLVVWAGVMLWGAARLFEARRLLDDAPLGARLLRRLRVLLPQRA